MPDDFRRCCEALRRLKETERWPAVGALSFEASVSRALGLSPRVVRKMVAIGGPPIGGAGRRPGPKPREAGR